MIAALRNPDTGSILIDGVDVRELDKTELRSRVLLLEEHELFEGTVLENVLPGPTSGRREVRSALESVGAHGRDGAMAQRPRHRARDRRATVHAPAGDALMIARVLLARPRVVLVDETLDRMGELDEDEPVLDALFSRDAGWTLMVVSSNPAVLALLRRSLRARGRLADVGGTAMRPTLTFFLRSEECLPAMREAGSPFTLRALAKWLGIGFVVTLGIVAFVPWQQNVPGTGEFSALAPLDRRQSIDAPVSGRVVNWHVSEGSRVGVANRSSTSPTTIPRSSRGCSRERDAYEQKLEASRGEHARAHRPRCSVSSNRVASAITAARELRRNDQSRKCELTSARSTPPKALSSPRSST